MPQVDVNISHTKVLGESELTLSVRVELLADNVHVVSTTRLATFKHIAYHIPGQKTGTFGPQVERGI